MQNSNVTVFRYPFAAPFCVTVLRYRFVLPFCATVLRYYSALPFCVTILRYCFVLPFCDTILCYRFVLLFGVTVQCCHFVFPYCGSVFLQKVCRFLLLSSLLSCISTGKKIMKKKKVVFTDFMSTREDTQKNCTIIFLNLKNPWSESLSYMAEVTFRRYARFSQPCLSLTCPFEYKGKKGYFHPWCWCQYF